MFRSLTIIGCLIFCTAVSAPSYAKSGGLADRITFAKSMTDVERAYSVHMLTVLIKTQCKGIADYQNSIEKIHIDYEDKLNVPSDWGDGNKIYSPYYEKYGWTRRVGYSVRLIGNIFELDPVFSSGPFKGSGNIADFLVGNDGDMPGVIYLSGESIAQIVCGFPAKAPEKTNLFIQVDELRTAGAP